MIGFRYEDRGYETPCRIWQGATSAAGYGVRRRGRRLVYVHRDEYMREHVPLPPGRRVLHHCDQPDCANLEHLFDGTPADNTRDALAKGRLKIPLIQGERHGNARLTEAQVLEIRAVAGVAKAELGRRYGVSPQMIALILTRRRWTHI